MRFKTISLLWAIVASFAFGQEPKPRVASTTSAAVSDSAAEVLAFEREMEAAVVRGM